MLYKVYYLRVYSYTDQTNLSQVCLAFSLFYQRISSAFSYNKQANEMRHSIKAEEKKIPKLKCLPVT